MRSQSHPLSSAVSRSPSAVPGAVDRRVHEPGPRLELGRWGTADSSPVSFLLGGLSIHLAVGTSLVIIALKSFTGFFKYVEVLGELDLTLDWPVLLTVAGVGMVGSFVGRSIGNRISQARLQRFFAVFLVAIGLLILWQTIPRVL